MNVLFIGGTGNISEACVRRALDLGYKVSVFNRGNHPEKLPKNVELLKGDIRKPDKAAQILADRHFDAVADFIAFNPEHIKTSLELFRGKTGQYIFISSASVYHKPLPHYLITESTSTYNPIWKYAQEKIACEQLLIEEHRKSGFPHTIVRPSHTYGNGWLPTSFGSKDYTVASRMLAGKEIIVHGDGTSLWTLTHTEDFAFGFCGLLGNPRAIGDTFHITSDEALSWDRIHLTIADALGVKPRIVHVPSEIIARFSPERGPSLMGDKAHSAVFCNDKIRSAVPDYKPRILFYQGVRRSLAWYDAHPEAKVPVESTNAEIDALLEKWHAMLG